ncbi:MAG TPA: FAD-binding oxidoreductase [Candidatus Paceibacterota bacterium]|nr:FAD-binding oxidoreductase [Candidatus Paceibacterota bacterium]
MLADEIKQFFHGEVAEDSATIETFSRDYSVFKVKPQLVVFPKDVDDVKNLVKFVSKKKAEGVDISITGRSAGTDMTGGPLNQGIIVSFTKYFNHVKEIHESTTSADEAYAVVEPGVYFRDFEKQITPKGLLYPSYPASKELCALGGIVNNNSGGEKTLRYGKTEDYVRELDVVLSDGNEYTIKPLEGGALRAKLNEPGFEGDIYRKVYDLVDKNYDVIKKAKPDVSKNSAGYYLWNVWDKKVFDLTKLIVGSQGTLAMLASAKLGLVRLKKHSRLCVIFLKDLGPVADLVVEVLKFHPESIESYDDKTMQVAVKFWWQILKSMKGGVFKLGWQFIPEMWMVATGGMPKMILLVELTGDDEKELVAKLMQLASDVRVFAKTHPGIQVNPLHNEGDEEKYWTIRRQSFALLHNNTTGKDTAPFIDDFCVKPEFLPEFMPKLNAILDNYKKDLIYTITGHPGNGNFHIIPLMDLKDPRVRRLIPEISEKVYRLVFQYHGTITAEHNDGLIRTPYLEEMYGPEIEGFFKEVKNIFDPQNIFNPGKKVGGNLKYSVDHITPTHW